LKPAGIDELRPPVNRSARRTPAANILTLGSLRFTEGLRCSHVSGTFGSCDLKALDTAALDPTIGRGEVAGEYR
jgi:hypothetical protein